jgi:hypothetical protein
MDSEEVMEERRKNRSGLGERRKSDTERIAETLKTQGRASLHVQGTGMMPLVRPGEVAIIRRVKLENMRSGDVVLFQRGEHLLAKRIGEDDDLASKSEVFTHADTRGPQEVPECLGQIVAVHRESGEIELSSQRPTSAEPSVVRRG